ncbi:MAG: short-chain dehydrogenase/reductase, partial [Pseudomonadota bacterium]
YNATKFAVEGLSEALWQEVEPLGIKVMLVEPSGFRSYGAGRSANESKWKTDDYTAMAGVWSSQVHADSGRQMGDMVRAAHVIVRATESLNPPHRLLLGNDAYEAATKKLEALQKEFSALESVSRMADFPMDMQGKMAWTASVSRR